MKLKMDFVYFEYFFVLFSSYWHFTIVLNQKSVLCFEMHDIVEINWSATAVSCNNLSTT